MFDQEFLHFPDLFFTFILYRLIIENFVTFVLEGSDLLSQAVVTLSCIDSLDQLLL
jgi:hypothetical protein